MIVAAVAAFMNNVQRMTMKDLIGIEQLEGYGMALAGNRTIGVTKLQIVFGADKFEGIDDSDSDSEIENSATIFPVHLLQYNVSVPFTIYKNFPSPSLEGGNVNHKSLF